MAPQGGAGRVTRKDPAAANGTVTVDVTPNLQEVLGRRPLGFSLRDHGGVTVFDWTCASCHVGGSGTDNNSGKVHTPAETGVDGAYAARTANKAYRTTPLRGLWQHPPYFHDGSAATLADVVTHYNRVRSLGLTREQQRDLVEYLKSL